MPADDPIVPAHRSGQRCLSLRRLGPFAALAALVAVAYVLGLHREISFEALIRHRAGIGYFVAAHGFVAVAAYTGLYVAAVSLSLPGGAILTVIGGLLFGSLIGSVAACLGALVGATIIFLVARSAFGEILTRRAGPYAMKLSEGFRADAFSYLLFLRLVPFPFWLVNLAPALFNVRLVTFIGATTIGILPATVTFAVFGAGLGSVIAAQEKQYDACLSAGRAGCSANLDLSHVMTPTLLGALAGLGVLALIPIFAKRLWRRKFHAGSRSGGA